MRTDGRSCSRETVKGEAFVELVRMAACCEQNLQMCVLTSVLLTVPAVACAASSGCFSFAYPSTQQQMLVWKGRPKW